MTTALVHHLDSHRGLILQRALAAGVVGMVPVPYLDDVLAALVRESLIRRLAELRRVDIDPHAVQAIASPRGSRLLQAATLGSAALAGTRRIFRRVAGSLLVVRRVDEAMQTFQVGTLFDHYCARHHVGLGLDGKRAIELRLHMDRAIRDTHGDALQRGFRSTLRIPLLVPRLLMSPFKKSAPLDAEKLDEKLREVESAGWLQRAAGSIGSIGKGYAHALAGAFDEAWSTRT